MSGDSEVSAADDEMTEEQLLRLLEYYQQRMWRRHEEEMSSETVQRKLRALVETNPWLAPEQMVRQIAKISNENASLRSKRRKVIAIVDRVSTALVPYVACKPGCSQCCHMNTIIYEHEAIRLAEVTGKTMRRLPYRERDEVAIAGAQFDQTPCPFLVDHKCSVYEHRPLVCRTHHSLRDSADLCSTNVPRAEILRAPMYDPDILETPYLYMNDAHNPDEPMGNIAEFFPD